VFCRGRRCRGRLTWGRRLTLDKTDAGKTDYRNKRKKFCSHTASLEKRCDRSQRISLTNERKVTMKDCGKKEVGIKKEESAFARWCGVIFSAAFGIRRARRSKTNTAHLRACVRGRASLARCGPASIGPYAQSAARDGAGFLSRGDKPSWLPPGFPATANGMRARTYSSRRTSSSGFVRPALMSSIASAQRSSSRPAFASASI